MKEKEDEQTSTTTGFLDKESSQEFLHAGEQLQGGCLRTSVKKIQYGTGNPFNMCSQTTEWSYSGFPASGCSFTNRSFRVDPGTYPDKPPRVVADPSLFERWMPSGSRELRYSDDDLMESTNDAWTALLALKPQRHMNVAQAVCELKDTKQTIRGLTDFIKWGYDQMGRVVGRRVKRRMHWFCSLAEVASAYLAYKFGVEPTISDVSRFIREVSSGQLVVKGQKTKRSVLHKGEVVKTTYQARPRQADVAEAMFGNSSGWSNISKDGVASWNGKSHVSLPTGTTWITAPRYTSTYNPKLYRGRSVTVRYVKGCYFARAKDDYEIGGWDAVQRRLGWNCPVIATMWELTPFSFLVDWVVDVGSYIRRLERQMCSLNTRSMLGPIWEWRKEIVARYVPALVRFDAYADDLEAPTNPGSGGSLNLRWVVAAAPILVSKSVSFNRRAAIQPDPSWPVLAKSIHAYQISTGMALLVQTASELLARKYG